MSNAVAIHKIKTYLSNEEVKKRFNEVLKDNASAFMASIVNVVSNNSQLQKCDPSSVMNAAFIAATLDLPIDPNLGFSAIVPYGGKAQFQIQWKGLVQLAIRTGQYEGMNVSEVYEDEIQSYNPITGEVEFVSDFNSTKQRNTGDTEKICGYYAWFNLINGFRKTCYMTVEQIDNHAKQYSKAYQYDLKDNKSSSVWSTNFDAMAKKTVMKLTLSKWGIMSTKMKTAVTEDQKVYASAQGQYIDCPEIDVDVNTVNALSDYAQLSEAIKICSTVSDLDGVSMDMETSKLTENEAKSIKEKIELRKVELKGNK